MISHSPFTVLRLYLLKSRLNLGILLFIWLFLIYSEVPIVLGAGKVFPSVLLIPFILVLWPLIELNFRIKHLAFILLVTMLAVFTLILKADLQLLINSIFKILQFAYSITICVFTYLILTTADKTVVKNVLIAFLFFFIIGCSLERLGIIRDLTDFYRIVYGGTSGGGEINLEREFELAGFLRPYLFTAEPSLVGLGFFVFITCLCWLSKRLWIDSLLLLSVFIMIFLLGSPTLFLAFIMLPMIMLLKHKLSFKRSAFFVGFFLIVIALLYFIPQVRYVFAQLIERISTEIVSESSSMYARIFIPYLITVPKVLSVYPLFGVGVGNFGAINLLFGYNYNYFAEDSLFIHGANGFASSLVYWGILGLCLLYSLILYFHKSNKISFYLSTLVFLFLIGQMFGAVTTPRLWGYIGLYMAVLKISKTGDPGIKV